MKKITLIFALTTIVLSSCFIPDNYELDVVVHKDGSYEYTYDGELNYAPAIEAVIKGEFDEKAAGELQEIIENLKEEDGFESVKDLGKGKIKVIVKQSMDGGSDNYFINKDLKLYSFVNNNDGELTITGFEVEKDALESVKALKTRLKGKLSVTLPKKMKIVSENADKKSKVDKNTVQYEWKLDIDSEKPMIVIKQ